MMALCGVAAIATAYNSPRIEAMLQNGLSTDNAARNAGKKTMTVVNQSARPGTRLVQPMGHNNTHRIAAAPNMADSLVFYGLKYNDQGYNDIAGGPYNVIGWRGAKDQKKWDVSPEIQTGAAACYAKGKFYTFEANDKEELHMYTYDAETWKLESDDIVATSGVLRQVAAYNPTNGKAYVMAWGDLDWDTWVTMRPIFEVDLEAKSAHEIGGRLEQLFIQTMFFDNEGQCYGIPYNENELYKISLEDASYEKVCDLDLPFPKTAHSMSAVTDPVTNLTYWAVPSNETSENFGHSYLYTIDRQTGHCELVGQLPNNEHVLGLYLKYAEPASPAAASNFGFADGQLTFTVPTTTYCSGEELSDELKACIVIDGGEEEQYTVEPGQTASIAMELSEGFHQFNVRISNAAGHGAERVFDAFVGNDAPSASTDVQLEIVDGVATLTWKAATTSVNGGPYDDASVHYTITRYPEDMVVAEGLQETTYTEAVSDARAHYQYKVTAFAGETEGESALSNEVAYGSVWYAPYTEEFKYDSDFATFKIHDGRGDDHNTPDQSTWWWLESQQKAYLSGCGSWNPDLGEFGGYGMDDWLISPAIALKAGQDYRVRYDFEAISVPEHLELYLSKGTDVDGELTLLNEATISWEDESTWKRCEIFSVEEDGLYHLMWRDNTPVASYSLMLDNIRFDVYANYEAPAAVAELTATAAEGTALENTLTFTAPTQTYKGETLSNIERIDIYRNGSRKATYTFESPAPGAQLAWTDTECGNGMNEYRVVAYNAAGQGQEAVISNWVGLDIPAQVVLTSYYMNDQNQAVVSWEAVGNRGIHGGFVDPTDVTYSLCCYEEWNWDDHWPAVKQGLTETTATDDVTQMWWQDMKKYLVRATNAAGTNDGTQFAIALGDAYQTPFCESFAWGFAGNSPWTLFADSYYYAWNITDGSGMAVKPYDDDNGMLSWQYIQDESNTQRMQGPRVSIVDLEQPELSFMMWHGFEADPEDVVLHVLANVNDEGFEELGIVDYNNGAEGWARASFLLPAGIVAPEGHAASNVQIAFVAEALLPTASVFIDQIKIGEGVPCDLAAIGISGAKRIEAGETAKLQIAVANYGTSVAEGYQVVLHATVDGEAMADVILTDNGNALNPGQSTTYTTEVAPARSLAGKTVVYTAEVITEGDANAENNLTSALKMLIHGSTLPVAEDLKAEAANEGGIVLTWQAPSRNEITDPVNDDFEDYESFIIDEIGDWLTYDGDGNIPVYFSGPEIPHCFDLKAWQVWSPEEAGFSTEKFDVLVAHSGNKYLTSWTGSDGATTTLPTEDWLISADVQGGTDVNFYVRVPNAGSDPQGIRMMYSTTDQEPESFVEFDSDEIVGTTEWVYLSYTLPADARYFAVVAYNNGGMCTVIALDDIEFTPLYGATTKLTLKGYNVYRNDELIASEVEETTFVDTTAEAELNSYNVTAVWAEGESNYSNTAEANAIVGLDRIEKAEAERQTYNMAGQRVNATERGAYITRQGNEVRKLIK